MALQVAEQYRRWFEYEKDSHAKVAASLAAVPQNLQHSADFQKAVDLLAHIVGARRLWLFRLGVLAEPPRELFLPRNSLSNVQLRLKETESAWTDYLNRLTDEEVAREFEYQSLEGPWFRNTIADILTQLFGHSLYHRGQVAALVRSLGCQPAETDFVFWTRQATPERAASLKV